MILDMLILAWMASRYEYVDYTMGDPHAHLWEEEEMEAQGRKSIGSVSSSDSEEAEKGKEVF